jgi:hypothetical protein
MPKTGFTPSRAAAGGPVTMHTVVGTADQLATVIGHAEADGRLVRANRPRPLTHGRYMVVVLLRQPHRRELVGKPRSRYARTWRALTSTRGKRTVRITAICLAIAAVLAALAWLVVAVVIPAIAWVIAHGLYILGGLVALVIIGGLIAGHIDRCPTCGR